MSEKDDVTKANEAKAAAETARKAAEAEATAAKAAQEEAEAKMAAAERKAAAADRKAAAAERQGLPDLERAQRELEDANKRIEALEAERDKGFGERDAEIAKRDGRIVDMERGGWVRAAASAAGFHDAEDAVLRLDLSELDSQEKATAAVTRLAEDSKHLVKQNVEPTPTGILEQVLKPSSGAAADKDKNDRVVPADQLNAMTQDQLIELAETDRALYDRSLAAAAEAPAAA